MSAFNMQELMKLLILGYIRLPDGSWHKTNMLVAKQSKALIGFIIIRRLPHAEICHEIYMCAVNELYRGQGLGKRLIKEAIANLPEDGTLVAECLPKARPMKKLLQSIGLESIVKNKTHGIEKFEGQIASIKAND